MLMLMFIGFCPLFTCESSYCFQCVSAITILSVCHMGGSVKNNAS